MGNLHIQYRCTKCCHIQRPRLILCLNRSLVQVDCTPRSPADPVNLVVLMVTFSRARSWRCAPSLRIYESCSCYLIVLSQKNQDRQAEAWSRLNFFRRRCPPDGAIAVGIEKLNCTRLLLLYDGHALLCLLQYMFLSTLS